MSSLPSSSSSVKHADDCPCDSCCLVPEHARPLQTPLKNLLRSARSAGGFKGMKPIRVRLFSVQFFQGSAAPGTNSVNGTITLTTGNFPELASFLPVYDEMRFIKGKLHYLVSVAGTGGGTGVGFYSTSVLFDQTVGAPSSVNGVLEETFSQGPHAIASIASNYALNPIGMRTLSFYPPSSVAPVGTNTNVGRAWFILDSTNAPHMCQINHFCTSCAGTAATGFSYYVELDVELRMRT
jgi:hypothetical protein